MSRRSGAARKRRQKLWDLKSVVERSSEENMDDGVSFDFFNFVFSSFHNPPFPKIKDGVWTITLNQDVISEGEEPADDSRVLNFQR